MLLGQIFQSMDAWRKLSGVNMKPKVAYKILKYTKRIDMEYVVADAQRVALIREITGTGEGEDASIEPGTEEFVGYVNRLNEVMAQEVDLPLIDLQFGVVIEALEGKDDVLSVSDLSVLEPFFAQEKESADTK